MKQKMQLIVISKIIIIQSYDAIDNCRCSDHSPVLASISIRSGKKPGLKNLNRVIALIILA